MPGEEMLTSRQGRSTGGQLPALAYYPEDNGGMEDDDAVVPSQSTRRFNPGQTLTRLSLLEGRLAQQELTTSTLLDRALKVKKDVIDSLEMNHGTWYEEKQARQLLQDHIRTITDVVKKLNHDIQYLEAQIRERDGATVGTHTVVKNLELNQVAGVTDLRGRVVRCDTSIARLSADLKNAFDTIRNLSQQQQEHSARVVENVHALDTRIREVRSILDKTNTEQTMHLQHVQTGTSHQMTDLDSRNRSVTDELRHEMEVGRTRDHAEREKMETRIIMHVDKALTLRDSRLEKLDLKLDESMTTVHMRQLRMEEAIAKEIERATAVHEAFENRIRTVLDSGLDRQNDEIGKIKRESRAGFSTVHDTIVDMKKVLEGKLGILEERMRKEIGQLRKMVVLV